MTRKNKKKSNKSKKQSGTPNQVEKTSNDTQQITPADLTQEKPEPAANKDYLYEQQPSTSTGLSSSSLNGYRLQRYKLSVPPGQNLLAHLERNGYCPRHDPMLKVTEEGIDPADIESVLEDWNIKSNLFKAD